MPDLADSIFDAPLPAGFTTGEAGTPDVDDSKTAEPEEQDVDLEGQGKDEHQPATPGEEDAKEKESDEDEEQTETKPEGDGKKKREGAAEARAWGEKWKQSHDALEAKLKEAEPVLKLIDDEFGGEANLKFAGEIYKAISDEENFDAEDAWEFLSDNVPGVAEKLVQHIAKNIVDRADKTAIKRTFGRDLSAQEISTITDFLAAGKPATSEEFSKFFKGDDIPESLKFDIDGNEIPTATIDYMRRQQQLLNQTKEQLQKLEGRMDSADTQQQESVAAEAVAAYIGENFGAISDKITELGLDKALENETADVKEFREEVASAVEGLALWLIGKDKNFQAMYNKALSSVAKGAITKGKDRIAKANAEDFSRRIQAKVKSHAARAAKLLSPVIDAFSAQRGTQVDKATKGAKTVPKDSPGSGKPKAPVADKKALYEVDPFEDVTDVVADMRRRGELRTL